RHPPRPHGGAVVRRRRRLHAEDPVEEVAIAGLGSAHWARALGGESIPVAATDRRVGLDALKQERNISHLGAAAKEGAGPEASQVSSLPRFPQTFEPPKAARESASPPLTRAREPFRPPTATRRSAPRVAPARRRAPEGRYSAARAPFSVRRAIRMASTFFLASPNSIREIGRASCRERV